jgi:hypothetical protein
VRRVRGYLKQLIHKKRLMLPDDPATDDLLSALIRASDEGEHLTEDEAAAMAFILLFAELESPVRDVEAWTPYCSPTSRAAHPAPWTDVAPPEPPPIGRATCPTTRRSETRARLSTTGAVVP